MLEHNIAPDRIALLGLEDYQPGEESTKKKPTLLANLRQKFEAIRGN
jgi:hypothetical protein